MFLVSEARKMTKVGMNNESTRNFWIEKVLKKVPIGSRILDAGAGEQQFKELCAHLDYVSQDFGKYDGIGDSQGLQVGSWNQKNLDIISDITAIPEPDSSFDAILCTEVFEHLSNPLLALNEFSRLLKQDGHLILTAPFCSLTHFAPYHYYSGFNRYFYMEHLQLAGFCIIDLNSNGNFFEYLAQEIRRVPSVTKQYCNTDIYKWELLVFKLALKLLERFSKKDNGSEDILCFGYQIHAIKK
jgi:ubiquinone/menaquinone biosynthesis C-methylase UbiE